MYQNSQLMGQTIVMPDYGQNYPFSVKSSLNQENSMKSPDGFSDESVESPESNENSNQYVPLMPFVPLQSSTPNDKEQIRPDSRYIKSQPHTEVTTQKDRIRLDDGLTYNDGQYLYCGFLVPSTVLNTRFQTIARVISEFVRFARRLSFILTP